MNVGIDLGTTFSFIGHVNSQGLPVLFPDCRDTNEFATPSVVYLGEDGCLIGKPVEEMLDDDPSLPIVRFARMKMGSEETIFTDHRQRTWPSLGISALILRKLKRDAESAENEEITSAVLAIPPQFMDAERRDMKEAGYLGGFPNVRLVEEPVAAATYYGLAEKKSEQTLFVYHLGGGTFEATILQSSAEGLYVLATEGTKETGGKNFDETLMGWMASDFRRKYGIDVMKEPVGLTKLKRVAEQLKIKLNKPGVGQVRQSFLLCGKPFEFMMTRSQFERFIAPQVDKTIEICERCLKGASFTWDMVDKILLTGGTSSIPLVEQRLRKASHKPADSIVCKQPQQAISYGAALLASQQDRETRQEFLPLVHQVASYDLGMRTWDKRLNKAGV